SRTRPASQWLFESAVKPPRTSWPTAMMTVPCRPALTPATVPARARRGPARPPGRTRGGETPPETAVWLQSAGPGRERAPGRAHRSQSEVRMTLSVLVPIGLVGVVALLYGVYLISWVLRQPEGNERMRVIARAVQEGASAYLNRQYAIIA